MSVNSNPRSALSRQNEAKGLEHERLLEQAQGKEALKHAISAADFYLKAVQKGASGIDAARLRHKVEYLLELGETIKANDKQAAASSRPPELMSTRVLPMPERAILYRSSKLHGLTFPPWTANTESKMFSGTSPNQIPGPYIDPTPFSLSPEQQTIFSGWKRPTELVPEVDKSDPEWMMTAENENDLAQDLATDCSVVASLCAASPHFTSKKGSLLSSLIHPFDYENMRPKAVENGPYLFRLNFNGCWRSVVIDDRLPATSTDRTLYVVDRRNPKLLWPALVEKAYLKIRGGYDFPGSNSGTDLHVLTGWIPEQIFLKSDDIELDQTWDRIKKGYDEGNAILTLGTGNIPPEEEEALGLVREHDYAVLDLQSDGNSRSLLIKNPWVDSLVWTGVGSSATLKTHTVGSTPEHATNQFWMAFEDALQHFDSLYVNWNPNLFRFRQDHHFKWDMPDATEEPVFTKNPQYSVLSRSCSPIWVLLSRHWQDGELEILRERKAERDRHNASLAHVSKQLGFMSLSIFAASPPGTRLPLPESHRCLHQGPYVDSPNTLLHYDPTPNTPQTLVVAQGELPLPAYNFTLSFFSASPLTISKALDPLPYSETITGAWTRRSSGGSAAHPPYFINPQYSITLPQATPMALLLSTDVKDLPIHIALIYSSSPTKRITSISGRDILVSSPEYQRGRTFCQTSASQPLDAGTYTVILSTFEPGQLGRFVLRVSTNVSGVVITPVMSSQAGKLRSVFPELAVFKDGEERLRGRIGIGRLTRLSVVARATTTTTGLTSSGSGGGGGGGGLRMKLELGTGPGRRVLGVSKGGEFTQDHVGVLLGLDEGEVDVDPEMVRRVGGLWVVLEQIGGGAGGAGGRGVQVEVYSDGVVSLGDGGWECVDED
ncbi:putative calpain-like protease palB/rim-13 [Triangularia setosa]|uniref:Calpain-like protease palB/rim-13 n=1 Tax=Triangularia setosa TaxID=2587417 RepID=A0AAN7A5G3_9PEZI|nr:putative calpain-like protease palB/rim-13 [Podospora setosa]